MPSQNTDDGANRLTARIVEEGYVRLQETLRAYRQAKHQGNRAAGLSPGADPTIVLQDSVQTFFELVRPYVKGEPRLDEYWQGAIARHPEQPHHTVDAALQYYRENSVGVWQAQSHVRMLEVNQPTAGGNGGATAATDGGEPETLGEWHQQFNLPRSTRILSPPEYNTQPAEGFYYHEGRFAVLGLREIESWTVDERTVTEDGDGFLAGKKETRTVQEPEPEKKVETAARMLVEVADELDAIATYKPRGERVHGTPVPDDA